MDFHELMQTFYKVKIKMTKATSDKITKGMTVVIWIFIFLYSLTLLTLYLWIFMNSFKNLVEFNQSTFSFPKKWEFTNYLVALQNFKVYVVSGSSRESVNLIGMLYNSIFFMVGCSFAATIAPAIVSYATSRFKFKFNKVLDGIVIITMVLPIIGSEASLISMLRTLGLYDNMFGMFFMKFMFLGFNYLLLKGAFNGLPSSFAESAKMDGASKFHVMALIEFPMIGNILMIVFAMQLMGFWADWTTPLMYMPSRPTVAYGLYELQFTSEPELTAKSVQFAAAIMASIPTFVIFTVFRKQIMGGVAFGGLKG